MKNFAIVTLFVFGTSAALADAISFECGAQRGQGYDKAQVALTSEDVNLRGGFQLQLSGKAVADVDAKFSAQNNRWVYVVSGKHTGNRGNKYVFSGPSGCQDDGDVASLSIYQAGVLTQTIKCVCSSD